MLKRDTDFILSGISSVSTEHDWTEMEWFETELLPCAVVGCESNSHRGALRTEKYGRSYTAPVCTKHSAKLSTILRS